MTRVIYLLVGAFVLANTLFSQTQSTYREGIILHYGVSYPGYQDSPGLFLGAAYQFGSYRPYHIGLRGYFPNIFPSSNSLGSLNLGTGLRHREPIYLLAAYAGPSILWELDENEDRARGLGLYAQTQLFLFAPFLPVIGVGLITYANLNPILTHYGVTLGVYLGNGK